MSRATIVRYRTRPDTAEENARLVRAVFAQLAETRPAGVRYMTFQLEDGVSFVHVALFDGDANPLLESPAFQEFAGGVGSRCDDRPVASSAAVVGAYGWQSNEA